MYRRRFNTKNLYITEVWIPSFDEKDFTGVDGNGKDFPSVLLLWNGVSGQNRRARKNPALSGPEWDSSPGPSQIAKPSWSEDEFILLASLSIFD